MAWNVATLNVNSIIGGDPDDPTTLSGEKREIITDILHNSKLDFMALQETRRDANSCAWDIPDYVLIERFAKRGERGKPGLALIVRKGLNASLDDRSTDNIMWVSLNWDGRRLHIFNVYMPCNPNEKEVVMTQLAMLLHYQLDKDDPDVLVVMGDFNTHPRELDAWLMDNELELDVMKNDLELDAMNNERTSDALPYHGFTYRTCETTVDYIMTNTDDGVIPGTWHAMEEVIFDHVCLCATVKTLTLSDLPEKKVVNRTRVLEELPLHLSQFNPSPNLLTALATHKDEMAVKEFQQFLWEKLDGLGYVRGYRTGKCPRPRYSKGVAGKYVPFSSADKIDLEKRRQLLKQKRLKLLRPAEKKEKREMAKRRREILRSHDVKNKAAFGKLLVQQRGDPNRFWNTVNARIESRERGAMRIKDQRTGEIVTDDKAL